MGSGCPWDSHVSLKRLQKRGNWMMRVFSPQCLCCSFCLRCWACQSRWVETTLKNAICSCVFLPCSSVFSWDEPSFDGVRLLVAICETLRQVIEQADRLQLSVPRWVLVVVSSRKERKAGRGREGCFDQGWVSRITMTAAFTGFHRSNKEKNPNGGAYCE